MEDQRFVFVGIRPADVAPDRPIAKWYQNKPMAAIIILGIIILGCLLLPFFTRDAAYMDLMNDRQPPSAQFPFGTDTMGRDIFAMVWAGGRVSLLIGFMATFISTAIAVIYGTLSALAPQWLDTLLMRLTEIFLSIPSLLIIILIQAILGKANVFSISIVIGITGWYSIAKVVRTEVRQLRGSEYVIAARCMGAGFFRILWRHLTPNFLSSIMFMVVMNIRSAIVAESTLSFIGIGLPLEVISWGSMLSLSENALTSGAWWIILIPGLFLVVTLLCVTEIGNYIRSSANRAESHL